MKIGLIDVDGHNFPNLALMKLAAWHKQQGDDVEWWWGFGHYDRVYMSKVFDGTYTPDVDEPLNADEIIKGGTGYGMDNTLPGEVEHIYPDYSLYPELTKDTAYGFLTRGCPRACPFCIVANKEGRTSKKVADLSEWWNRQKNIILMDSNIMACRDREDLLQQLAESKAYVEFNGGIDARFLTEDGVKALNQIRIKIIHFAWDLMEQSDAVLRGLQAYAEYGKVRPKDRVVYTLTNYNTSMKENLERIYTIRDMGFTPYVMIYDKPNAPHELIRLQRWCNNKFIFNAVDTFEQYKG